MLFHLDALASVGSNKYFYHYHVFMQRFGSIAFTSDTQAIWLIAANVTVKWLKSEHRERKIQLTFTVAVEYQSPS